MVKDLLRRYHYYRNLIYNMPLQNNKKEVIAIIPARGGSKGIPKKNIVDLCGKPLIAYTIEVALKSEYVTRVIVSTDDEEIAIISERYGAEVPFLRPVEISGDSSNIGEAYNFTRDSLIKSEGSFPDISMILYPTHLFRSIQLINLCATLLIKGHRRLYTVKKIKHNYNSFLLINDGTTIKPLISCLDESHNNKAFCRIYGTVVGYNFAGTLNPYMHTLKDPVTLIDIDTPSDLFIAEEVIKNQLFDFGI